MKEFYFTLSLVLTLLLIDPPTITAQSYAIKPYTARSKRPTSDNTRPSRSYDNDIHTLYLSAQHAIGIPDTLDYYFPRVANIDTIVYTPRQDESQDGQWGEVEIWAANDYPFTYQLLTTVDWQQTKAIKTLHLPGTGIDNPSAIRFVVKSAYNNFSSVAEMAFYSPQPKIVTTPDVFTVEPAWVAQLGDLKLPVAHAVASSFQSGSNINKSYDGDLNTLYHSNYNNRSLPYTLTYDFTTVDKMDYIIYHPRQDGNKNGVFGRIKVEARTATGTFQTLVETYDCELRNAKSIIRFPDSFLNPAQVRITVLSSFNNFASAAEIEFYQKRENGGSYQTIFTDALCSELQPGVTETAIDTISVPFFKALAQRLFHNLYRKKFRLQHYAAIPPTGHTKSILGNCFQYSRYQNPTGIAFKNNDIAIVFVSDYDISQGGISLKIKDFDDEESGTESQYPLKPGLNKFTVTNNGLAYIDYYSNASDLPPVAINIVTGGVNGFLTYDNYSFAEWLETLVNYRLYPKIDMVGNYITLNIDKIALQNNALFTGKELLQKWDSIVKLQFYHMGLVKYNLVPRNKMFGWVESKGGYYAINHYAHYDLSWNEEALTAVKKMDLWGISHELGHLNQILNGLKWTGTTEVTNNIYSAYASYVLGTSKLTRLETQNDNYMGAFLTGNLYNICHNEIGRKRQNLMSYPNSYNLFARLIPFWQLQLYYAIAGAGVNAPTLEQVMANKNITGNTDYANWLGITAQTIRNSTTNYNNGQQIMNFVKFVSDAVQQDLTKFFTKTGFLIPFDAVVGDYTSARITITQADIDATKAYIASKNYPEPQSPVLHYITARNLFMYKNNLTVEGVPNTGFTIDSTSIPGKTYYKIAHTVWKNAVAFETIDINNDVLFITTFATGDATNKTTMVLFPEEAVTIYAVGSDGTRMPVISKRNPPTLGIENPESAPMVKEEGVSIYPNPAKNNITLTLTDTTFKKGTMISTNGQIVKRFRIKSSTNITVGNLPAGLYLIILERSDHSKVTHKIMVNRN